MTPNHEWETPIGGHKPHWGGWETPLWGSDPLITSGRPHWWAMTPNHEWETPIGGHKPHWGGWETPFGVVTPKSRVGDPIGGQ